jgi:hypothetical protein
MPNRRVVRCLSPISSFDGRFARAWAPVAGHFGEKARCPMKTGQSEWTCRHCGRRNETAVVAGETVTCEFCNETSDPRTEAPSPPPPEDATRRNGVVTRLRERYGEARKFVLSEPPMDDRAHDHLEWILGKRSNPEIAGTALDTEVSELVVLWLQDLARELDNPASFPGASGSDRGAGSTAGVRRTAADGLRAATRDFAEEFLRIDRDPVAAS